MTRLWGELRRSNQHFAVTRHDTHRHDTAGRQYEGLQVLRQAEPGTLLSDTPCALDPRIDSWLNDLHDTDSLDSQNTVNQGSKLAAKAWSSSASSSPSSASSYKSAQSRATSLEADDDDDKENKVDRARHGVKRVVPVAVTVILDSDDDTDSEEQVIELSDSSVEIQVEQHRRQLVIQDSDDEDGDWSDNDDESEEAQSSAVLTSPLSTNVNELSWLTDLLAVCTSAAVQPFDDFVSRPPRAVRGSALAVGDKEWHKVGEASFSEVFRTCDTVVKIVPLHDPAQQSAVRSDWPMLSEVDAVTREIKIASAMSKVDGFVEFKGAYVVKGLFATALLEEWDDFKAERVRQKHPEAHLQARPGT